jgi:hypothetical protein
MGPKYQPIAPTKPRQASASNHTMFAYWEIWWKKARFKFWKSVCLFGAQNRLLESSAKVERRKERPGGGLPDGRIQPF